MFSEQMLKADNTSFSCYTCLSIKRVLCVQVNLLVFWWQSSYDGCLWLSARVAIKLILYTPKMKAVRSFEMSDRLIAMSCRDP